MSKRNRVSKAAPTAPAAGFSESPDAAGDGSREASGDARTVRGGFNTYGITGLARYGGVSRVYEEFLRELQGPQGMKNYREMLDNDPIVGAIMFAAQHLCRKVSVGFKPANDTNEARKVADFVGGAIFDDMESTWPDTVSEIMSMLPFGWAMMEVRLKRRLGMGTPKMSPPPQNVGIIGQGYPVSRFAPSRFDDGMIGFRSWSLRSQETLFMWEFDEDSNAVVMQQMAPPDYKIRRVPVSKCLLFRTQVSKNNPEGRSIFRNAWVPYYMKKNLQIFEGIGIERDLAGYPIIKIAQPEPSKGIFVPDIWNAKDPAMVNMLSNLQRIVKQVRVDEQMGLVMPWWAEFELVNGGSRRRVDTNSIISRYDQRIAMSCMADFIMLGHEAVGSKALAATKISLFTSALSSFLDVIGAIIDRQAVTMLMEYNGFPTELTPTFYHGDVESVNIEELGQFVQRIAGTGFNPMVGIDAQKAAMQAAHLPTTAVTGELTLPVNSMGPGGEDANHQGKHEAGKQQDNKTGDKDAGSDAPIRGGGPPAAAQTTNTGQPDILNIT